MTSQRRTKAASGPAASPRELGSFLHVLANIVLVSGAHGVAWFALVYFVYLQTRSVFASGLVSGLFFATGAVSGVVAGNLVDRRHTKALLQVSCAASLVLYAAAGALYAATSGPTPFRSTSPALWSLVGCVMISVMFGSVRSVSLPALVADMVGPDLRPRANGLVGVASGASFLLASVISGLVLGLAGMGAVLGLAYVSLVIALVHLSLRNVPDLSTESVEPHHRRRGATGIRDTISVIRSVAGLPTLLALSTMNNLLGGVITALMDPYGLSMVSVQEWGVLWGALSTVVIVAGLAVTVTGVGAKPVRLIVGGNAVLWAVMAAIGVRDSLAWLLVGLAIYMAITPYVEAAEQTVLQTVVPRGRQGRVFGLSQSIEQAGAPLTALLASPLAQFAFMPFMSDGAGARLLGPWFGTGPMRGIALLFTVVGLIGVGACAAVIRGRGYRRLSASFRLEADAQRATPTRPQMGGAGDLPI